MSDLPPVPPPDFTPPPPAVPPSLPAPALSGVPPTRPEGIRPMPEDGPAPSNPLGLAAFIVSIVGFCVPVLGPLVALTLGVVALFARPRGFAITAIVLSALQLVATAVVFIMLFSMVTPAIETKSIAMSQLLMAIEDERANGVDHFPIGAAASFDAVDGWGNAYRVEVIRSGDARTVFVWSAGGDGEFDTADDFVAACDPMDAASKAGKREFAID